MLRMDKKIIEQKEQCFYADKSNLRRNWKWKLFENGLVKKLSVLRAVD